MRRRRVLVSSATLLCCLWCFAAVPARADQPSIDFNRDIRPILSNNCFHCHGPDENERMGGTEGLRLDNEEGAFADLGGYTAIVRGQPEESELIQRVVSDDEFQRMPPEETGKRLSEDEVRLLTEWVRQGAPYARHWSYVKPQRPPLPEVQAAAWPHNGIDQFILARLQREGLSPSPEADRYELIRRVTLDLTGLPPTLEEVERFVNDSEPLAYERLVERLLQKDAYGEHWARMWLDLARYADSAGYADDPPRTIWAYRDYVIQAFNANKPFDQFTIEQIAGDLLPDPTPEQLVATAFHRNTLTNNEGGTNDEEFRNVAVVDRVNTTMAVWMGTTIACAQCHSHKYDPITQEEFFGLFALFNNTADADRRDESPLLELWSEQQKEQQAAWQAELAGLEKTLATSTEELRTAQAQWERRFASQPHWQALRPAEFQSDAGAEATLLDDGRVLVAQPQQTDVYTVDLALEGAAGSATDGRLTALRVEALPHEVLPGQGPGHAGGNFVLTRVRASVVPPQGTRPSGRFVRVEIPGSQKILSLAEVQVFSGQHNVAPNGQAKQSSTDYDGPAHLAIDGNTDGNYQAGSTTHTAVSQDPWWEVDLKGSRPIDRIVIWNRTDGGVYTRLKDFRIAVLDEQRQVVWEQTVAEPPQPSVEYSLSGVRSLKFAAAYADFAQSGFEAAHVLDEQAPNEQGWAVGDEHGKPHWLTLVPESPAELPAGSKLRVAIEQLSKHPNHTLGHFRISLTGDADVAHYAGTPSAILALLKTPDAERSEQQQAELAGYYRSIAPELQPQRERLAELKKQLAELKPATTVPVMRELPESQRRTTRLQYRGNFLDLGDVVTEGVPSTFHPLPEDAPRNRLTLAHWLVGQDNPLTARVVANRYWEAIFGVGIVSSSEEFGSQGELPTHPELLDWLATELVQQQWDVKYLLKLLVTSATYRQSSRVTPELLEVDRDNLLLARGPRFRLSAEMIRDQALFVSGLLSPKRYGPPVKPPQPSSGLSAAFGSGIDWQTSDGEDRYRRGLYTTWRRSNPYPSMVTFDAPNREICTVRRARTNTPLQALVTLNDPVYIEAAQALARRMAGGGTTAPDKARHGFRLCLARSPGDEELEQLVGLYEEARQQFSESPQQAKQMATQPLGPAPPGMDIAELAAWTVVGNVLLNLDEMFMKR